MEGKDLAKEMLELLDIDANQEVKKGAVLSQSNISKVKTAIEALSALLSQVEPEENEEDKKQADIDNNNILNELLECKKIIKGELK